MSNIKYQCFTQTSAQSVAVFLLKLQFMGVSRVNLEVKETLSLNSSVSRLVLKQESRKSWPNPPESYTNGMKVNLTQKGTEIFYNANKKNLPMT